MMKKLLVVLTVLAMATVASASLKISVNGVVDPPDTDPMLVLAPSDTVVIDIHATSTAITYLMIQGPGSITKGGNFWAWEQSSVAIPSPDEADLIAALTDMGFTDITHVLGIDILDTSEPFTQPNGKVIDGLVFHCDGVGIVTLTLLDVDLNTADTQILQLPEPITFALLGLGGLFLRRRK